MTTLKACYPEAPEPLLLELAKSGDRDAFTELVSRHQAGVRKFMRQLCGDESLADDLAQQVFVKLYLGLRTIRHLQAFPAWFKRLKTNVWLEHVRRNEPLNQAEEWQDEANSSVLLEQRQPYQTMDLQNALLQLQPPVRLCIVLAYVEGMSHGEVSKATGFPLGTVKSHLRRGNDRLKTLLAGYEKSRSTHNV